MAAVRRLFLLQLAGPAGTGKSSLARMVGYAERAVVLDKDVIKSALLAAGEDASLAGGAAYEIAFALADHLLGQEFSVVLDSPSAWETIPAKGQAIAERRGARYHFVECVCPEEVRLRRLEGRACLTSQTNAGPPATVPPAGAYLRVDTTQPIEQCLRLVLEYLQ